MDWVVGIDIGGTAVKAGLFSCDGELAASRAVPTGSLSDEAACAAMADELAGLPAVVGATAADVVGVGIDVPGPVDAGGRVLMLPNADIDAAMLQKWLRAVFPNAGLAIANDVNAAALGELWRGAAIGSDSFVLVAIGTGVGAGVVLGGKVVAGAFGTGGELGHVTVNRAETRPCGCGRRGCLEQYASASGIVRCYLEECAARDVQPVCLVGPTDTLAVFEAYRAGDAAAHAAVSAMCDSLGFAFAQVATIVDPGLFLVGGGVGAGFDLFADELREAFARHALPAGAATRILPASLGNRAAMYGCAHMALHARQNAGSPGM